ncbi:hypothetical protein HPHPH4_1160 [Helicobacter pylori Hp H-4]|nr:hypothetical protein HPHPH4_1160 [Helicobacter pylori Hp H-4]
MKPKNNEAKLNPILKRSIQNNPLIVTDFSTIYWPFEFKGSKFSTN